MVDVGQSQGRLEHYAFGLLLGESALGLIEFKGIFGHKLEDHFGLGVVLVELVQFDDIGVVHRFKEEALTHAYFLVGFHDFDGDCFSGGVVDGFVD